MNRLFRKLFRPNAQARRVLSGLCAAFMVSVLAVSSFLVTADADHDCHGEDCPVCQEIQVCVSSFQLLGSASGGSDVQAAVSPAERLAFASGAFRAPSTTLHALAVRFDE